MTAYILPELGEQAEPRWRTLFDGVEVLMRPVTRVDWDMAQAQARADISRIGESVEALAEWGFKPEERPALLDEAARLGLSETFLLARLAERVIVDWNNVNTRGGDKAPIAARSFRMVMRDPRFCQSFRANAEEMSGVLEREGKD